jgi:hypothetical protein
MRCRVEGNVPASEIKDHPRWGKVHKGEVSWHTVNGIFLAGEYPRLTLIPNDIPTDPAEPPPTHGVPLHPQAPPPGDRS